MTNYIITQTEIHHVSADSVKGAYETFEAGIYDCATSINVQVVEADFKNGFHLADSQFEIEEYDGDPEDPEAVTLSFRTLKTVQNEEIFRGIQYAIDYLEDINYHDGANALSELFDILKGTSAAPQWQSEFFSRHPLYSVPTE